MGIQGLLPMLKPITTAGHVEMFRGQRLAVDTYSWLHRSVYGSCIEIFRGAHYDPLTKKMQGEVDIVSSSTQWLNYVLQYVDLLLYYEIEVYLVFDGAPLPAKRKTEDEREKARAEALETGQRHLRDGNEQLARQFLSRAIDITPRMAAKLIQVCKDSRPHVKVVVAPYEADAQLAYMSQQGIVDAVVSEDSDTIPFGCKNMIFKLEKDGFCQIVKNSDFSEKNISGFDLRGFTIDMIRAMCIASGCDYLSSLSGIGIKKSHRLVSRYKTINRLLRALRFEGIIPITQNSSEKKKLFQYEVEFYKAMLTFQHQVVFCVQSRKLIHLTPLDLSLIPTDLNVYISENGDPTITLPDLEKFTTTFLGSRCLPDDIACAIADGHIDPETKLPFEFQERIISNSSSLSTVTMGSELKKHFPLSSSTSTCFQPPSGKSHSSLSAWSGKNKSGGHPSAAVAPSAGKISNFFAPSQRRTSITAADNNSTTFSRVVTRDSSLVKRKSYPISTSDYKGGNKLARSTTEYSPYFPVSNQVITQNLTERRQLEASLRCTSTELENNSPLKLNVVGKTDSTNLDDSAVYELQTVTLASVLNRVDESESFLDVSKFSSFAASEFTPEDSFCGYEASLSPPVSKRPFIRFAYVED